MNDRLKDLAFKFSKKRILVVGDIMLDKYIHGEVLRISPEAPVQVLKVKSEMYLLGGCGNVANNLRSLGAQVTIISSIGRDKEAENMKLILKKKGIKAKLIETNNPTIVKTRIISQQQQLLRIDYEKINPINSKKVLGVIKREVQKHDAIIISDYAKGMITKETIKNIVIEAGRKLIIADPKHKDIAFYEGVSIITPNEKEAFELARVENDVPILEVLRILENKIKGKVVLTRGEKGIAFLKDEELIEIPTMAKEIFDVTGAGDTVISILTLALASGAEIGEATNLANQAAGIVVEKFGTATVEVKELIEKIEKEDKKIKTHDEIEKVCLKLKKSGEKIIFTNGCFDVLHIGHLKLLQKAKSFGDILVLGLNTDASVRKYKGPERPIIPERQRAEMLAALSVVDYISLFDENTPIELIKKIKPDVHIKGGDYRKEDLPETKIVEKYGGKVEIIKFIDGWSTSNIIKKIKNTE